MSDDFNSYSESRRTKAREWMKRAGYPTGDDVQALGPKPVFTHSQEYVNRSSWDDPTPPTKASDENDT